MTPLDKLNEARARIAEAAASVGNAMTEYAEQLKRERRRKALRLLAASLVGTCGFCTMAYADLWRDFAGIAALACASVAVFASITFARGR